MTILGLTDEQSLNAAQGLAVIGRLRKGEKRSPNAPGRNLDHFRLDMADEYQAYTPMFHEIYGDRPTQLDVMFIGDSVDDVFPNWLEEWGSTTTLYHRCDGETQVLHWDKRNKDYNRDPNRLHPYPGASLRLYLHRPTEFRLARIHHQNRHHGCFPHHHHEQTRHHPTLSNPTLMAKQVRHPGRDPLHPRSLAQTDPVDQEEWRTGQHRPAYALSQCRTRIRQECLVANEAIRSATTKPDTDPRIACVEHPVTPT